MSKKPPNWTAIKKRYLQGEKPKDIAADYGLTAKQVTNRACNEKWARQKKTISDKVEQTVLSEMEQLRKDAQLIFQYAFGTLKKTLQDNPNPYLFDGEGRSNPLYIEAMKVAGKLITTPVKDLAEENEEEAGGLIGGINLDNI